MTFKGIALSAAALALAVSTAAPSLAADAKDARFVGSWAEAGPQSAGRFDTVVVGGKLKLTFSKDLSPPDGETLWLQRTGPDLFTSAPGDKAQARFQSTGPNTAKLSVKELDIHHLHIFDRALKRR